MRRWLAIAMAGLLLQGCVSAELNTNMLDLASTVGDLQSRQVLTNLGRFIDNPDALPAQAVLIAGTVQVVNSVTPSTVTPLDMVNRFERAASLDAVVQWTENWNVAPVTEADDLRRLRALYRFAVYGNHAGANPSPERAGPYDFDASYVPTDAQVASALRPHAFTGAQAADASGVLHTGWLFWGKAGPGAVATQPAPLPPGKLYPIGNAGQYALFTSDRAAWGDFVVAVLGALVSARSLTVRPVLGVQ